ncbi:MAG: SufE family protein [Paludibacteraceae bacterium]|nr:SufE family protein [Paludibacteraceae bacterium]
MTIQEKQDQIIEEFSIFEDWFDKYALIIEYANKLAPIDESKKTPQNIIEGCQSRVWIDAELNEKNQIIFVGDSDAIIVRGILALLLDVVSGHTPNEILHSELYFIDKIGLKSHLSPTRSNGLVSMLKQLKLYSLGFSACLGE